MNKITVNSFNCEFGYELISVIPYAYWLYLQGRLKETISAKGTEFFYYFSPKHTINPIKRNSLSNLKIKTPNGNIHIKKLDKSQFSIPDYRKQFANETFEFEKPIVVISNRYNNEWSYHPDLGMPINFFSLKTLEKLFKILQNKYQVIYLNIEKEKDLQDEAPAMSLDEWNLLDKYPKVKTIYELKYDMTYNEAQLKIFANTSKFITLNGGGSILASFFGGTNIIYCKETNINGKIHPRELQTGDFGYYSDFANSKISIVNDIKDLLKNAKGL